MSRILPNEAPYFRVTRTGPEKIEAVQLVASTELADASHADRFDPVTTPLFKHGILRGDELPVGTRIVRYGADHGLQVVENDLAVPDKPERMALDLTTGERIDWQALPQDVREQVQQKIDARDGSHVGGGEAGVVGGGEAGRVGGGE